MRLGFAPTAPERNGSGPGCFGFGDPRGSRIIRWRRQDLPSSWGTPIAVCPVLRPRSAGRLLTDNGAAAWPPLEERRRRRHGIFRGSIAWLSGWLSTLRRMGCPTTDARLASRCWSGSPGRACYPQGFAERFRVFPTSHPPFPSFLAQSPCFLPAAAGRLPPAEVLHSPGIRLRLRRVAAPSVVRVVKPGDDGGTVQPDRSTFD